MDHQKLQKY